MLPQTDQHDLSQRARAAGVVLWASFLAAGAGTTFFFAFIAPDALLDGAEQATTNERLGVYTLGFFGLWLLAALASALSLYLYRATAGPPRD